MLIDRELNKLIHELKGQKTISFIFEGNPMTLHLFDGKLSLAALVYEGGNYIPKSVRNGLSLKSPGYSNLKTTFSIDEEKFQISLNYLGSSHQLNNARFYDLLEEFNDLVGGWRFLLDERDRNDLVHIWVK